MNIQEPSRRNSESGAMTVRTLLIVLLASLLVCVVGLGKLSCVMFRGTPKAQRALEELQAQQERDKAAAEKAAQEAKLALARNRQGEALSQARNATNLLARLLADVNQLRVDAVALRTNDAGRLVALHPDLIAQAKRFYETELGAISNPAEIITKLENSRRVELQVAGNLGTAYEPEPQLALDAQNAVAWAEQEQQKLGRLQNLITSLVSESKIKVTSATLTADSPTLESAIRQLAVGQATDEQKTLVDTAKKAEAEALITKATTDAQKIKQDALAQSNRMFQAMQEQADAQRREDQLRQATNRVKDAQAAEEARKVELRKKAADPEVKTKLAPFITPGYWTPRGFNAEKKPLSYTMLQSQGVLDPSERGLGALARLAMAVDDKVRPRWNLAGGRLGWYKVPASLEKVKEAQQVLIELGPVLVEMKLLDP